MQCNINGDASNFANGNYGVIAGGNVTQNIVHSSQNTHSQSISALESSLSWRMAERTRCPWEDWDLDKTFFRSLSRYTRKHPEARLDRVLVQIFTAMGESQEYLPLVPDDSFPAQSLVKGLGCLFKLGIVVKQAKRDVLQFTKEVVEWIQAVQSTFEDIEHDQFTSLTYRSLQDTRDLINEICTWARCLLADHRWVQIRSDHRMKKEIDEFRFRLEVSKEIFKSGISAILTQRFNLFPHEEILDEIRRIKKRKQDQLEYLVEEIKRAQVRRAFLKENLDNHVVSNPSYNAQGKFPCDEGTRKAELTEITEWLNSISSGSQNFLWLTGDPGCGKSAITASLAEHCRIEGVLWAQFFINRNNVETTNPNTFFPTIARQLADISPEVEYAIHDQLKVNPTLSNCMTLEQATKLFIDALTVAAKLDLHKIVAVIIDGLDETERDHLYNTADIFSRLFKSLAQYPNVKVLVSSRTEDDIRKPFARRLQNANVKHVHLDTRSSIEDVALCMRRQIEGIVERHELKWEEWPTETGMELLATRASGLFIWAVTAVRYLRTKIEEDGQECLGGVLKQLTGKALEGINNLYTMILLSTQKKLSTDTEWEFEKFRRIIGTIIVLREPQCLADLAKLLNLRYGPDNVPVDIAHFVRRLRTVLVAGTNAIDGTTVPRLHISFFDFITDATLFKQLSLDHRYCVDPAMAEEEMVMYCIRLFANSRKDKGGTQLLGGSHLEYASRFCISHVDAAARKASMSTVSLVTLHTTVESIHTKFSTARQNGLTPWFPFDLNGPLASFSPLTSAYQVTGDRQILATTKSFVQSLAYSPDGEKIVSGLTDGRLILWNAKKGTEIAELEGHTKKVFSVAFSPLGDRIASGSSDRTVRIWNVATTQLVALIRGHSKSVFSVVFSPVENVVASASFDQCIRLWNADSGESVGSPFRHDQIVWSVTFSKDGSEIFSGAGRQVYIWNRNSGECQQKLKSHINFDIHSVAISPIGDRLVTIGPGGLCFWNRAESGFVLDDRLTLQLGRGLFFFRAVFFPDGKSVLVSDESRYSSQFFVYDLSSRIKIAIHNDSVEDFALSPDGSSVVFSVDKNIHTSNVPRLFPVTFTSLSPDAEIVVCIFSDGSVWLESPNSLPFFNKKLDGNVGNVKHLTFSSDNSLLAAVNEKCVYLWDVPTRKLRACTSFNNLGRITALSFLADRRTLTTTHEDQIIYAWYHFGGHFLPRPVGSLFHISFDSQLLLDADQDNVREIAGTTWFPSKSKNSGLWAYVDGTLIRVRRDGSVTLLPLDSI